MPIRVFRRRADNDPPLVLDSLSGKRREHQHLPAAPQLKPAPMVGARRAAWILIRPEPGFYLMRAARGGPLVPALIYQLCPMVVPHPTALLDGAHPDDWCRPLDRSPQYRAQIDGRAVAIDRVWTARSLRSISFAEYQFRIEVLRRWAYAHPRMPEAQPHRPVDLAALPPLF